MSSSSSYYNQQSYYYDLPHPDSAPTPRYGTPEPDYSPAAAAYPTPDSSPFIRGTQPLPAFLQAHYDLDQSNESSMAHDGYSYTESHSHDEHSQREKISSLGTQIMDGDHPGDDDTDTDDESYEKFWAWSASSRPRTRISAFPAPNPESESSSLTAHSYPYSSASDPPNTNTSTICSLCGARAIPPCLYPTCPNSAVRGQMYYNYSDERPDGPGVDLSEYYAICDAIIVARSESDYAAYEDGYEEDGSGKKTPRGFTNFWA